MSASQQPVPITFKYLGAVRSIGGLYVADPKIPIHSKSLVESILSERGMPEGLFPVYCTKDTNGHILAICINFVEHILYQSEDIQQKLSSEFIAPMSAGLQ